MKRFITEHTIKKKVDEVSFSLTGTIIFRAMRGLSESEKGCVLRFRFWL